MQLEQRKTEQVKDPGKAVTEKQKKDRELVSCITFFEDNCTIEVAGKAKAQECELVLLELVICRRPPRRIQSERQ